MLHESENPNRPKLSSTDFINSVKEPQYHLVVKQRVDAEHLLLVRTNIPQDIKIACSEPFFDLKRQYFTRSRPGEANPFSVVAEASFQTDNRGNYYLSRAIKYGEGKNQRTMTILGHNAINDLAQSDFADLEFDFADTVISIVYQEDTIKGLFTYDEGRYKQVNFKKGEDAVYIPAKGLNFEKRKDKRDMAVVKTYEDGRQEGLSVSSQIDIQAIKHVLAVPKLLADPFNAPSSLDSSWVHSDFKRLFGIQEEWTQ